MVGNPHRRRKHHKRRHRNPESRRARVRAAHKGWRHRLHRNPVSRRSHRRHRRHSLALLRNPGGAVMSTVKEATRASFLMEAVGAAVGFVLPNIVVLRLPATWRDTTVKVYGVKAGTVLGLSLAAGIVNKKLGKLLLLGGGISLALDLYTDFIAPHIAAMSGGAAPAGAPAPAPAAPASAPAPTTGYFYGDGQGVGYYYGSGVADAFSE